MKFILIVGPQAVGKMTIGQELEKMTDLKLLHNHQTIDLLQPLFGFTPEMWKLSSMFREEIFKTAAQSDMYGLIFTYVCDFNAGTDAIDKICSIFEETGGEIYIVELEADVEERLKRNNTPHRLKHKPTKRNLRESEENLLQSHEQLRLNSLEGELDRENYVRINNTNLSALEVATRIKNTFQL
ncbi:shikimate kinase [Lottiidibacillus patelloidae]|uniref:Shikimate kinase n=1 Tax=Lottiidibacillus patelloidae TaxID=2670334 RepID=A0A263BVL2_9BACI|nr:AAA family ATPase [Lottiidibacillus patelloidae]OZM57367.1 shikimate kinase [Lottiidibacillus patelloidae]